MPREESLRVFCHPGHPAYSSKRAFDFNAGGKGADLLRMKIFAERYGFKIKMDLRSLPRYPQGNRSVPRNDQRMQPLSKARRLFCLGRNHIYTSISCQNAKREQRIRLLEEVGPKTFPNLPVILNNFIPTKALHSSPRTGWLWKSPAFPLLFHHPFEPLYFGGVVFAGLFVCEDNGSAMYCCSNGSSVLTRP